MSCRSSMCKLTFRIKSPRTSTGEEREKRDGKKDMLQSIRRLGRGGGHGVGGEVDVGVSGSDKGAEVLVPAA